uniref:(northern house mosquito) hypothetical protein n=1 Tax=Culex pipiens TaxID=7175 RepID=A0A8D8HW08_CULPI
MNIFLTGIDRALMPFCIIIKAVYDTLRNPLRFARFFRCPCFFSFFYSLPFVPNLAFRFSLLSLSFSFSSTFSLFKNTQNKNNNKLSPHHANLNCQIETKTKNLPRDGICCRALG